MFDLGQFHIDSSHVLQQQAMQLDKALAISNIWDLTDIWTYQMIGDLVSKETVCCVGGNLPYRPCG